MSALRTINVRGMRIEIWDTSFRIEGMAEAVQVGPNLSDKRVKQLIEAIFDPIRDTAMQAGKQRAVNFFQRMIMDEH